MLTVVLITIICIGVFSFFNFISWNYLKRLELRRWFFKYFILNLSTFTIWFVISIAFLLIFKDAVVGWAVIIWCLFAAFFTFLARESYAGLIKESYRKAFSSLRKIFALIIPLIISAIILLILLTIIGFMSDSMNAWLAGAILLVISSFFISWTRKYFYLIANSNN
jgi:hypothetical protein